MATPAQDYLAEMARAHPGLTALRLKAVCGYSHRSHAGGYSAIHRALASGKLVSERVRRSDGKEAPLGSLGWLYAGPGC